jgi:hypothetical protein
MARPRPAGRRDRLKELKGSPAPDAGLLAAAQAVEHYEISRYGTLKTWADELGLAEAAELLDATLQEEKKTDEALTELAQTAVNQEAAGGGIIRPSRGDHPARRLPPGRRSPPGVARHHGLSNKKPRHMAGPMRSDSRRLLLFVCVFSAPFFCVFCTALFA